MTDQELAALRSNINAIEEAIRAFTSGDRVSEVRFADRTIKYSEITLPQLQAERDRLLALMPSSTSRISPVTYRGL